MGVVSIFRDESLQGVRDGYSSGSFNLGRRGESAYGDICSRVHDKARRSVKKTDGEKLNHDRDVRSLAVKTSGDGAEPR
jgi:hypothetical protein